MRTDPGCKNRGKQGMTALQTAPTFTGGYHVHTKPDCC